MSKIHYFQRYSTPENTITNNTLQLLARIYQDSASRASSFLTDITGEPVEIGIEISQQKPGPQSTPDGRIVQRSFEILIESKIDLEFDGKQLLHHAEGFQGESQQILLLLTKQHIDAKDKQRISETIGKKYPNVVFCNATFETICTALGELFADHENEMQALSDDYIDYCNDAGLVDQSRYLMRIVSCRDTFEINREHGVYYDPSDRGYRRHDYVGIYKDKAVRMLWKIESVFDVDYEGGRFDKALIQGCNTDKYDDKLVTVIGDAEKLCGHIIKKGHRFFCGIPIETNYVKTSFGGLRSKKYVNLKEEIGDFSGASEVAEKLNGKHWQ
ncbi:MAG: hypothetical protein OXU79_05540 [Gemmatimonadota bacterium]|nr:hypothetical protein [Gemmatimonadota bacterium]